MLKAKMPIRKPGVDFRPGSIHHISRISRVEPLRWHDHKLVLLDQTLLPDRVVYFATGDYRGLVKAIRRLAVRGAPLIGVAGAFGIVQEAYRLQNPKSKIQNPKSPRLLARAAAEIKAARPTAVNLAWAVGRLERIINDARVSEARLPQALEEETLTILHDETVRSKRMGHYGATLVRSGMKLLTICNAGILAAPGLGTALAVMYVAQQQGKAITVYVPETRPLLQGSRLTAFELSRAGIPVVVLTDSMLATIMPEIDLVLVGADRIAANGDTANKIGTYQMALLAHHFRKPFYPVAPVSTFDFSARSGKDIPIEQRAGAELMYCGSRRIAPPGLQYHNPAFDVTPARFITGIVTDQGILRPPFRSAIARLRR